MARVWALPIESAANAQRNRHHGGLLLDGLRLTGLLVEHLQSKHPRIKSHLLHSGHLGNLHDFGHLPRGCTGTMLVDNIAMPSALHRAQPHAPSHMVLSFLKLVLDYLCVPSVLVNVRNLEEGGAQWPLDETIWLAGTDQPDDLGPGRTAAQVP